MPDPDSDSDYVVEEYIRPEKVSVPLRNDESADLLGNFKEKTDPDARSYESFPKEIFLDSYDHDQPFVPRDGKKKEKSAEVKKKIRKKVLAKIGREMKKKRQTTK